MLTLTFAVLKRLFNLKIRISSLQSLEVAFSKQMRARKV